MKIKGKLRETYSKQGAAGVKEALRKPSQTVVERWHPPSSSAPTRRGNPQYQKEVTLQKLTDVVVNQLRIENMRREMEHTISHMPGTSTGRKSRG